MEVLAIAICAAVAVLAVGWMTDWGRDL